MMKNRIALLTACVLLAVPAFGQRPEDRRPNEQRGEERHEAHGNAPRANHGRIPDPPQRRESGSAPPEQDRREGGRVSNLPHVHNDHWYGHDSPNEAGCSRHPGLRRSTKSLRVHAGTRCLLWVGRPGCLTHSDLRFSVRTVNCELVTS